MIIMDYGGRATLAKAFDIVEQCDCAPCQHDASDVMSILLDSSKSSKTLVVTVELIEAEGDKN